MELADSPLSEIKGISPRFIPKLKKLGIISARDLLLHIPKKYVDFSHIVSISNLKPQEEATIHGIIIKINSRRTWHRKMYLMEAFIEDSSGTIRATWFNQPYIKNVLTLGREVNFSGKPVISKNGELYLSNPAYEIISKDKETKHTGRIVPIYPETKGLTSKGLRYLISMLFKKNIIPQEILPQHILKKEGFPNMEVSLKNLHFPEKISDANLAKKRFVFETLLILQLKQVREKESLKNKSALSIPFEAEYIKKILKTLLFQLTLSQKKSLLEITKDLSQTFPMNRLLQGDVGSGKTIVAEIAGLIVAEKTNAQVAFMAPTEILARQHYHTFQKFFPSFEKGVALLTSSDTRLFYGKHLEAELKKDSLQKEIENGKISIIIGTHALIQKTIKFKKLGLVIIDEQHRFGVAQRAALLNNLTKKQTQLTPHFLSMSATPIPRTLSLAIFGDLDISVISELPKDRKEIITKAVATEKRNDAYEFIRKQVASGRQVFVVCPRIKPSENDDIPQHNEIQKLEIKSVKEEYEKLSKKIFPELRVEMLHGKMPAKGEGSKEHVMRDFVSGKIDVLISTSVIEVGVDVPNASIMMIEGAERFGLAQLYQFRGRVGRGKHQSYCFLFTDSSSIETKKRIDSIVKAKNGLELAERDLILRGPGEFLGEIQTGMPDYVMQALKDPKILQDARRCAKEILEKDQNLKKYPLLSEKLSIFEKRIHLE